MIRRFHERSEWICWILVVIRCCIFKITFLTVPRLSWQFARHMVSIYCHLTARRWRVNSFRRLPSCFRLIVPIPSLQGLITSISSFIEIIKSSTNIRRALGFQMIEFVRWFNDGRSSMASMMLVRISWWSRSPSFVTSVAASVVEGMSPVFAFPSVGKHGRANTLTYTGLFLFHQNNGKSNFKNTVTYNVHPWSDVGSSEARNNVGYGLLNKVFIRCYYNQPGVFNPWTIHEMKPMIIDTNSKRDIIP